LSDARAGRVGIYSPVSFSGPDPERFLASLTRKEFPVKRIVSLALASLFVLQSAAFAYQDPDALPMTNTDVVKMVKAKIAPEVVVAKIEMSRCHFDTQPSVLTELRQGGVPDSVLMAMIKAPYGAPLRKPEVRESPTRRASEPKEASPPKAYTAKLAEGTTILVTPTEEINSKYATEGQVVTFRVTDDVEEGGLVFVKTGSIVRGTVTNVEGRGMLGKAGKLSVSIDSVKAVDGQKVRLRAVKGKEGGSNTGKVIALSLLVTPLFLLMRGNTARIKPGTQFQVFTDEEKEIQVGGDPDAAESEEQERKPKTHTLDELRAADKATATPMQSDRRGARRN
jgi:hypothetical protein